MFRGSHTTRVDDKGRLKLPAEFRRDLPETQTFYITSEDGRRALLFPIEVWETKEQQLLKMPAFHPARAQYLDVTSFWGQIVEMDSAGRLLLPQMLRDEAELTADVRVIGKLYEVNPGYLEVVNLDKGSAQIKAAPITAAVLEQIANYGRAAGSGTAN